MTKIIARKKIKVRYLIITIIVFTFILQVTIKLYLFYHYNVDSKEIYNQLQKPSIQVSTNILNDHYEEKINSMLRQYGLKKKIVKLKIYYYFQKYQNSKEIKSLYKIISWSTFYLENFKKTKKDLDIFYFIGKAYYQLGNNYAKLYSIPFLNFYLKKQEADKISQEIYIMLYHLYYQQKQYKQAKKIIEVALERFNFQNTYLQLLYIKSCYQLGLIDELQLRASKILLNENIDYNTFIKEIGLLLVNLLERLSLEKKTILFYKRLLEISNNDYDIAHKYGLYLINIGNIKKARSHFYSLYLKTKDKRYYELFVSYK